jgi:hypothetical protein
MATISSEALIGIGITVAWLGIMCLLLGWAEYMRSVPKTAWIWLALGVVLVFLGGLAALSPSPETVARFAPNAPSRPTRRRRNLRASPKNNAFSVTPGNSDNSSRARESVRCRQITNSLIR